MVCQDVSYSGDIYNRCKRVYTPTRRQVADADTFSSFRRLPRLPIITTSRSGRTRTDGNRRQRSRRRSKPRGRQTRKGQHPTNNNKMDDPNSFSPRDILFLDRRPPRLDSSLPPSRVLRALRAEMSPCIEMAQRIAIDKPRRIFGVILPSSSSRSPRRRKATPGRSLIRIPRTSCMRPLRRPSGVSVPTLRIEARRRAAERSASFTQSAWRS